MRGMAFEGYNWIIRAIDVATGHGASKAIKGKEASTCGYEMAAFWAMQGCPGILQTDNGSEFLGQCIEIAQSWTQGKIKIIHGRYIT